MKLSLSRGARVAACLLAVTWAAGAPAAPPTPSKSAKPATKPAASKASGVQIPIEYHKLDNGLKVVLSPDHSSPKVVVAVYYGIGLRNEAKDRTGFAHLFE